MRAYEFRDGDRQRLKAPRPNFDIEHRVESVSVDQITGDVILRTTSGEWRFDPREEVVFPRRESGRRRVHTSPPPVSDVYPGDYLILSGECQQLSLERLAYVVSVTYPEDRGALKTRTKLTAVSISGVKLRENRVFEVEPGALFDPEKIVSDIQSTGRSDLGRRSSNARASRMLTGLYGPFVNEITGAEWLLSFHPRGYGRWPSNVHPFTQRAIKKETPYVGRWPTKAWPPELKPKSDDRLPTKPAALAKRDIRDDGEITPEVPDFKYVW